MKNKIWLAALLAALLVLSTIPMNAKADNPIYEGEIPQIYVIETPRDDGGSELYIKLTFSGYEPFEFVDYCSGVGGDYIIVSWRADWDNDGDMTVQVNQSVEPFTFSFPGRYEENAIYEACHCWEWKKDGTLENSKPSDEKYPGNGLTIPFDSETFAFDAINGVTDIYDMRVMWANHDIVNCDTGAVVFQNPPMPKAPILPAVVGAQTMKPVMREIIGLIPLVILLVVGFLGLRKALQALSQALRKA